MFSVIIPLYNKAPYVEKAIRSVAAQTFREFELIVIDDGSTDIAAPQPPKGGAGLTYSDIEQLIDGKGILIKQKNSGVSTARNNGVALASYPYICFLDADDWWAPTFLEEMKALIEEFPEAGIYGTGYYIVKHSRIRVATIGVDDGFEKGEIDYCRVYAKTLCMPLWTGAVCIPKPVFEEEKGFKPALKLGEDFDLWIRIALKHKVVLLNKPLAYYNQDVEQVNRGVVDEKIYEPSTFVTFNLDYLKNAENRYTDLKILLDKLRVYSLLRYRIQNAYTNKVNEIISTVDFNNVDKSFYRYYFYPLFIIRSWYQFLKIGSKLKTTLRKLLK